MTEKRPVPLADLKPWIEEHMRDLRQRCPPSAPQPRCDRCDDLKWEYIVDAQNVRRAKPCVCQQVKQPKAAPGVPVDFRDANLTNYTETPANKHALVAARRWLENPARDLYLWGTVGSGKSRLAISLLNDVFASGGGYFTRVPMLLLKLQPSNGEHANLFTRCCATPLLVLDDVGAERESATDFTRRTLLTLYEERGDRALPTIWTSNKSLVQLADFMQDERLTSRIAGRAEVLEVGGDDWRVSKRVR